MVVVSFYLMLRMSEVAGNGGSVAAIAGLDQCVRPRGPDGLQSYGCWWMRSALPGFRQSLFAAVHMEQPRVSAIQTLLR